MLQNELMATSQQKSKVAQTRLITGETAEAFADIIGKSLSTLRSLESGRLNLSEDTAKEIASKTGVSFLWLKGDKATVPHCGGYLKAGELLTPFTRETYIKHSAKKRSRLAASEPCRLSICIALSGITGTLASAYEKEAGDVALYYLEKFAEDMRKQFGSPVDTKRAHHLKVLLGESLVGDAIAEGDTSGNDWEIEKPTPQKKQPSRKKP